MNAKRIRATLWGVGLAIAFGALTATASAQRQPPRFPRRPLPNFKPPLKLPFPKGPPKLDLSRGPDLYVHSTSDLTRLGDTRPLSQRLWIKIGNRGDRKVQRVKVNVYFWKIVTQGGQTRGRIRATRQLTIHNLRPGKTVTIFPYHPSAVSFSPISYSAKIDPTNAVRELRENNNRLGRRWTTYPDAFLRQYSYDPAP